MKKQILFLSLMLTLTACEAKNGISSIDSSLSTIVETSIEYKTEKTILSKGFQSIIPNVEVLEKERGRFFLVNLGVVECSMADIDGISRVNNEINIYTSIKKEWRKSDIVVPQITLEIKNIEELELKDLKFNIVPINYTPIDIKFDKTQILNKIYTQFKYTDNTMPSVFLSKENNEYIWNIKLNNTFIKDDPSSPLYMFNAKISSESGEIIEAKPTLISDTIGKGKILDFANDELITYVQKETGQDGDSEKIWLYNINSSEKQKIYSTHNYIYSAKFSPDLKKLAVIEHNGTFTDLYIIDLESNLIQKITPIDYKHHTWSIKWKDNNLLYAINSDENQKSSVIIFDILKNEQEFLFNVNLNVTSFDVFDDTFAFVEKDINNDLPSIYIKKNEKRLKKIDYGLGCEFISEKKLLYMKKVGKEEKYELYMYDLDEDKEKPLLDSNVRKFIAIDEENILIVSKDNCSTDNNVYLYNLKEEELNLLGQVLDKNIFYSSNLNTAFFSIVPPTGSTDSSYIYKINFNSLNEHQKDS